MSQLPDLAVVPDASDSDPMSRMVLADDAAALAKRFDDWTQALGGIGSFRDRQVGISFEKRKRLTRTQRDALHEQNAFAARVVELIVDEALAEGWEFESVEGVTDLVALHDRVQRELGLDDALYDAGVWSRKDGFALLTIPTDAKPEMPIGMQCPTKIHRLAVEPERSVQPWITDDLYGSPTYKQVTYYNVQTFGAETIEMHASHCVAFEPIALPPETLQEGEGEGKGPSVLDRLFDQLQRFGSTSSFANALMFVASLVVVKFEGYANDFRKPGGRALLRRKAQRMRADMDSLGILFLDKNDEIENLAHTMTGIIEILDRAERQLAAACDMPREIMFNESPTGLRGGELTGAQEIWHKKIRAYQKRVLQPAIEKVLAIAFRVWGMKGANGAPPKFTIKWRDLWTPSPEVAAETSLKQAQADQIYYDAGAASGNEIRSNRLVQGNRGPLHVEPAPAPVAFDLTAPAAPDEAAVETLTPADEALNGAQIASLVSIMTSMNQGLVTYVQALGAIGVAFPALRGREASVLGPPPATPIAAPVAAVPQANAPVDPPASNRPEPGDAASPRDIAAAYGVPTRTITLMIERGELEYWGLGKHKRVSASEVMKAAKKHENEPAPEEPDEGGEPDDEQVEQP